jgi:hypothetical protein
MPHHQSRQQRPSGGHGFPPGAIMGQGFVTNGRMGMDRRSNGMVVPPGISHQHAMQPWMPGPHHSFHPSNLNHQPHGRPTFRYGRSHASMPHTFSYDSTSSSTSPATLSPKQDYSSFQTSSLATTPSFDSSRHEAALALLESHRGKGADDEKQTERSRPLKKRKTVTPQKSLYSEAAHVSPISQMSTRSVLADSTRLSEDSSNTPQDSATGFSSMASLDDDDPKEGHNKARMTPIQTPSATSTCPAPPPTHLAIPHFPSVLHSLLTESEHAGSVVQWLLHGKAWKIVRWEALRRQVLPQFFPQLREEDQTQSKAGGTSSAGSIDAFLWHLTAWGFEEVIDGQDAGAYFHPVSPLVCVPE